MKLKTGIATGGGENAYRTISKYGHSCADFQMAHTGSFLYTCTHKEFEEALKQEKAFADANGIEIHQMHGPWDAKDSQLENNLNADFLRVMLEDRKKSIEACSYLGCKNWVIHPIFPYGREDEKIGKADEAYKVNLEFYSELLPTAKEYDVTICLENMPFCNFCINSPEKIKKFIDDINDDNFKGCLDTGHVICLNKQSLGEAVRTFGDTLRVLHVHDSRPGYDYHAMPFFGSGDWDSFYEGLCEVGYSGVFNLECSPPGKIASAEREELSHILVKLARQIMHYNEE